MNNNKASRTSRRLVRPWKARTISRRRLGVERLEDRRLLAVTVIPSNNADALRDFLLGSGITAVGSASLTGSATSAGFFQGGAASITMDTGIVLTSGDVNFAAGPNTSDSSSGTASGAGDPQLDALFSVVTQDTTFLQFDFTTNSGDLFFNFVFASEEYNEFVNSSFNDVFAFFVDGQNIAFVPGTSTPISINTINGGNPLGTGATNSQYYNNNDLTDNGQFLNEIGYDGFTTVLTATKLGLGPGTHTMKLAVSDVTDSSWDTAVFIQAGTFSAVAPSRISGLKFNDLNNNGARDANEPGLAGWTIYLDANNNGVLDGGERSAVTTANGRYSFDVSAGTYTVREVQQTNWTQTFPAGGFHSVTVNSGDVFTNIDFGNRFSGGTLQGTKWADLNGNAVRDAGEPALAGWTIYIDSNYNGSLDAGEPSTVTDSNGNYTLLVSPGTYLLREVQQPNWTQTYPLGGTTAAAPQWVAAGPTTIQNGQVENIAPNNPVVGAVRAIATHPSNPDVVYIGAVNGGIWRTNNATSATPTWTPLIDDKSSLSIGALEMDPANPNRLVAGIGLFSSLTQTGGPLTGLLLTTDGGTTWTELTHPLLVGQNFTSVALRGNTILAASKNVSGSSSGGGLFRSTDGGATFVRISGTGGLPNLGIFDLVGDPLVSTRFYATIPGDGIYRSDNSGLSWTRVTPLNVAAQISSFPTNNNLQIAVHNDGVTNAVYLAILNNGQLAAVFRSTDLGVTWTLMDLPMTNENGVNFTTNPRQHPGAQGYIHFSLAADPIDPNVVYVGGDRQPYLDEGTGGPTLWPNSIGATNFTGRLFRGDASQPAGSQWVHLTHSNTLGAPGGGTANNSAPHADSRAIAFDAAGNLLEADDGGIFRRSSPRDNTGIWTSMIGNLQISELHSVAYDTNSNVVIAGGQDVGTSYEIVTGGTTWSTVSTADGGYVAVDDYGAPGVSIRYSSNQDLALFRRQTFGPGNVFISESFPLLNVTGAGFPLIPQFYTPIALNAINPQRMIIGGATAVYESPDRGDTLNMIGPFIVVNSSPDGRAIAYGGRRLGVPNPDVLYLGDFNTLYVRTTAGGALNPVAYPGSYVQDIVLDPNDWQTAYVADINRVYRTTNAGASWIDITGNLAAQGAVDVRSIEFVSGSTSRAVVVGTNTGIYAMLAGSPGTWNKMGTGIPNALVLDLDYDPTDNVLVVGTLGRGAWTLSNADAATSGLPPAAPFGTYLVTVGSDQTITGLDFGNDPDPFQFQGFKWLDDNENGVRDGSEPGLAGWTIFLDLNQNDVLDAGEPSALTAADGTYVLQADFGPGTYRVVEVQQPGYQQTFPGGDGAHLLSMGAGQIRTGVNFGNRALPGSISGVVFNDLNNNGTRDPGEPGIPDFVVYLDLDGNGIIGLGEPAAVTNVAGGYAIVNLPQGNYTVREVMHPGWLQSFPAGGPGSGHAVTITPGISITDINFGNAPRYDYGDAPGPYPTLLSANGPVHGILPGFFLGSGVDAETNGVPSLPALGDDNAGTDDEDGVVFGGSLSPGKTVGITVTASQDFGFLQGWIDFNRDGDWDDPGEQVFRDVPLATGANSLSVQVPISAEVGTTYARFRYGFERGISYVGPALAGEVEDYAIAIQNLNAAVPQTYLGVVDATTVSGITLTGGGARYVFIAARSALYTAEANFLNANGDVNLEVYTITGSQIAISNGAGDQESANFMTLAGATYYIRLRGANPSVELKIFNQFTGSPELSGEAEPSGTTNPFDPYDVNEDGVMAPNDVALLVHDLNNNGPRHVYPMAVAEASTARFPDVNRDGYLSSADVAMLINRINDTLLGGGAASEGPAEVPTALSDSAVANSVDTGQLTSHLNASGQLDSVSSAPLLEDRRAATAALLDQPADTDLLPAFTADVPAWPKAWEKLPDLGELDAVLAEITNDIAENWNQRNDGLAGDEF